MSEPIKYRVTRDDNRYRVDATRYFHVGQVVSIRFGQNLAQLDDEGEVPVATDDRTGWILPDALEPVRENASSDTTLDAALSVLGLTIYSPLNFEHWNAVNDLAEKIKETREAING